MRARTAIIGAAHAASRLRGLAMTTRGIGILPILCGLILIGGWLPARLSAQTITSITNAASGLAGGVSPGEIVVIYGTSLGPATLLSAPIAAGATLPVSLGGVRVSFSGIAAPIVYASASQTAVQVPYELAGSGSAAVLVTSGNGTSPAFNVPVVLSAPGLFTGNYSGAGQVAALNVGGANSAQNPVPAGSSVLLFATGEGLTFPAGVDGLIQTVTTIRQPTQPISVLIAGTQAQVLFSGSVPGDLPGIVEIGVVVPPNLPANAATPVMLTIGGLTTTRITTLAVQ
jgi:uncharacterized protein (TIGR03437 family)